MTRLPTVARTASSLALLVLPLALGAAASPGAPAPWDDVKLTPSGLPGGDARHFRVFLDADPLPGTQGMTGLPASVTVDLGALLEAAGFPTVPGSNPTRPNGFTLDMGSFVLREVDAAGQTVGGPLPVQAVPAKVDGAAFDATLHPTVAVRWVMPGPTSATRHFALYFDTRQHGDKQPPAMDPAAEAAVATSIGPGRGTKLFVPLPLLSGAQVNEARRVRVTALTGATNVKVYEYGASDLPVGYPDTPAAVLPLSGAGDRKDYVLGKGGATASRGAVLLVADHPVAAEAFNVLPDQAASFAPNAFLPSLEGGEVGKTFIATPSSTETWVVACPQNLAGTLPSGKSGCMVHLDVGGPTQDIPVPAQGAQTVTVSPGPPARTVHATVGSIVVERQGAGLAAWPPLDGPATASRFLGTAGQHDVLLLYDAGSACIQAKSLNPSSAASLAQPQMQPCIEHGALTEDGDRAWGTTWARNWETGNEHFGGLASLRTNSGQGGLQVVSGDLPASDDFGTLVVPQSPDGGFHYDVFVPSSAAGTALGRLVLYAPYGGTGKAKLDGGAEVPLGPLLANQRAEVGTSGQGGFWHIEMDQPFLLAWLKPSFRPFGGPVPAIFEAAAVQVKGLDFAGNAVDLSSSTPVVDAKPGEAISIPLRLVDRGRDVQGTPLADTAHLSLVEAPDGWEGVHFSQELVPLEAGAQADVSLLVAVPKGADGSGATLVVDAQSRGDPSFHAQLQLRINFVVDRRVQVTVDGVADRKALDFAPGETRTFQLTVANLGSVKDSYTVAYSEPQWGRTVVPAGPGTATLTPLLAPGASASFFVSFTAPTGPGARDARAVTIFQATSTQSATVHDEAHLTTSVFAQRRFHVEVQDPVRSVAPGDTTVFELLVRNDSDSNQEFDTRVSGTLPAGWAAPTLLLLAPDGTRVPLERTNNITHVDPGGTATLFLRQPVPAAAPPFTLGVDRLRLRDTLDADSLGNDTVLRVLAARVPGFKATLKGPADPIVPGHDVPVLLDVRSLANDLQSLNASAALPPGWSLLDGQGHPPPWAFSLAPGEEQELKAVLKVPPATPPTGASPANLTVLVSSAGLPAVSVQAPLVIVSSPGLRLDAGSTVLGSGRASQAVAVLTNTGNVAMRVALSWDGLPDGWDADAPSVALPVNATLHVPLRLWVPANTAPATLPVKLRAVGDTATASAPWNLVVGGPRLQADLQEVVPLAEGATFRFAVRNVGTDAAFNVTLRLFDGDREVDRMLVREILPGLSASFPLAGRAGPGLYAVLSSDVDPVGTTLHIDGLASPASHGTPLPFVVLPALALAAMARRRRA